MTCHPMKDLTSNDYAAAGVSNHRILLMTEMTDEQRIRFLGVDVMTDVVTFRFAKTFRSPRVRKMMMRALELHLRDCDIKRRNGHLD